MVSPVYLRAVGTATDPSHMAARERPLQTTGVFCELRLRVFLHIENILCNNVCVNKDLK